MDNMIFFKKLPIPKEVKEQYPITDEIIKIKKERDKLISDILCSRSDKMLLIIGPCSADREEAVLDYIGRLSRVQEEVSDKIVIVPRLYTGKPRTTADGYKGLLHQPDPNGEPDLLKGIVEVRKFHMRAVAETHLTCADEMLYPENHRYISDILSYVAVGARSVENQQHRLTASGLSIPVGMKNPTGGNLSVMLNSVWAAQHPHEFIYRGWAVQSKGNPLAHVILRGYMNNHGQSMPNYHYEELSLVDRLYRQSGLENPAVIVDANHANSAKHYEEQPRIIKDVLHSRKLNPDIKTLVKGFMVESYIEGGSQSVDGCTYGKSITDPCLGWEESKKLIYEIAQSV